MPIIPVKPPLMTVLSLLLVLFFTTAVAQEKPAPEKPVPQKFKDWSKQCEVLPGLDQEVCYIFQNITVKKTGQVIMSINIHYPQNQKEPAMVVTLPLGVALVPGISVQVDEGESLNIPYNICINNGCRAGFSVEEPILVLLKKGNRLNISFATIQGKGTKLSTSLSGFTAAIAALGNP
ncbi:MAG: invasion associated locus B family protein [Sedimenticola sp.]